MNLTMCTVLIVESNQQCRDILRSEVEKHGHLVMAVPSEDEGLAVARINQPEVVLLDVHEAKENQKTDFLQRLNEESGDHFAIVMNGSAAAITHETTVFHVDRESCNTDSIETVVRRLLDAAELVDRREELWGVIQEVRQPVA